MCRFPVRPGPATALVGSDLNALVPRRLRLVCGFILSLLCGPWGALAASDGVSIEPGMWSMTTVMEMPMLPEPQVRTHSSCIEESELNPEMFQIDERAGCSINDVEVSGNAATWSIECPGPVSTTRGQWTFTANGDRMSGKGSMNVDMGEQAMEFTVRWEGERTGDCAADGP